MLGPMVNPSFPKHQLVGVFNLELARMYQYIYQLADRDASIVHSLDGYDECTLTAPTRILKIDSEDLLYPADFKLPELSTDALSGGNSVTEAAAIFLRILEGKGTVEQESVVIANAALALQHFYRESLHDSVLRASESLKSKKALNSLQSLLKLNQ